MERGQARIRVEKGFTAKAAKETQRFSNGFG
jgi:hypothetical protein